MQRRNTRASLPRGAKTKLQEVPIKSPSTPKKRKEQVTNLSPSPNLKSQTKSNRRGRKLSRIATNLNMEDIVDLTTFREITFPNEGVLVC